MYGLRKPAQLSAQSDWRSLAWLQMVRSHPLALQSVQLQHLIAEASAAQQGSEDVSASPQVQLLQHWGKPFRGSLQTALTGLMYKTASHIAYCLQKLPTD